MPANLSPEYKKAEAEFRKTREPKQRLECLREMLRTIPKHKGTEHLQADIKSRIKEFTEELAGPKKGAVRTGPPQAARPEGAAQIALIGPPNSGKSSLLAKLTGSKTEVGPYPLTTRTPIPGMLAFEDVQFQLVDLPPISKDFMEPWFSNALQTADAAFLVLDLNDPECMDHVSAIRQRLDERRVSLLEAWPHLRQEAHAPDQKKEEDFSTPKSETDEETPDPFRLHLPTLLVANKCDLNPDPEEVKTLMELMDLSFPAFSVSAETGAGLEQLGPFLFQALGIVRVYTKAPNKKAPTDRPYTLFQGDTVLDVARMVHKDMAASFKYAKVWGSGRFDGQQVGPDHIVGDKDIVELHA